jgi:hypothetical protein
MGAGLEREQQGSTLGFGHLLWSPWAQGTLPLLGVVGVGSGFATTACNTERPEEGNGADRWAPATRDRGSRGHSSGYGRGLGRPKKKKGGGEWATEVGRVG